MAKAEWQKWQGVKRSLLRFLAMAAVLGGALSFWQRGSRGFLANEAVILCLASGFWVTEMLLAVFTQVKKANPTAIALLLLGKLCWWGALFAGAKYLPAGLAGPVALGVGGFLFALLVASVRHYGMPRISDGNPPSDP